MSTTSLAQQENSHPPGNGLLEAETLDLRQFVTFLVGDEVFAVDMVPVQEIIRLPEMVRVPLAPRTLDGLANLRGKILPIISLRRIFGFADTGHDEATRALVIDIGQPLGFVVDRVASVFGVDGSKIEGVDSIKGTVKTELLCGLIKDVGGYAMIMVLDFAKLIAQEFAAIDALTRNLETGTASGTFLVGQTEEEQPSDELHLVSFEVAEQEYAMDIKEVQEIVQVPEVIVHVPHAESHVLGVMTLRNRLLPLVSLRRMFDLPQREANERSRILVVAMGNTSVGVVTDTVNEVLRVPKNVVDAMPPLLARKGDLADIAEICRLEDGRRLVSIVSASNLFSHSAIKEALTAVDTLDNEDPSLSSAEEDEDQSDDDEQVVVFRLDKEEFGVPIESVQEIVRVPEALTHVPKAPSFVEGVINLRGTVLPVIDLRRRLGLPGLERNDRQRVMVFLIKGLRTGFIVDVVSEVLKISKHAIESTPRLSSEQARLLARMANLEKQKRMVQLIEPAYLVEGSDFADLLDMAA